MSYLLDTNVVSELRKGRRCDEGVRAWLDSVDEEELYLSVLVVGEIRRGIERIRPRDPEAAGSLEVWLRRLVEDHGERLLPVDRAVAERWGRLSVPDPVPTVDGLLAATAFEHGLTLVTRNVADVARTGVPVLNPFELGG